jgi:hypothetical protein
MTKIRFIRRIEFWVPTLWGWIALCILFALCGLTMILNINSFLSPVHRVPAEAAEVLVVEGWLPDYALDSAALEFKSHRYNLCIVTGGPIKEGSYLSKYKSFADLAYLTLRKIGIDSACIVSVPSPLVNKDRTYASSVALREWIDRTGRRIPSINLFSLGCHSKRSQMLFSKALGKQIKVGVIACPVRSYDSRRWWHYSEGLRNVIGEALVYVYALFFSIK